jgi:hypothetical protein
VSWC